MTYSKQWETEVVDTYIKQESQQKSPEVFLSTHIPIQKIKAEQLSGGAEWIESDEEQKRTNLETEYGFRHLDQFERTRETDTGFIDEEQLFEHIIRSGPDLSENRIYMLKGEVGSGKSHLCQWLEYQINGQGYLNGAEDHVAIHISRNNTRLNDILGELYEHIDLERDELQDITELEPSNLATFIIEGLRTFGADTENISGFDLDEFIDDGNSPDLRSVLEENIQDYQESVEKEDREQRIDLLTSDEYREICFSAFGEAIGDAYSPVRNEIHDRLITNVGIEDFQSELIEVADQYKAEGKRPVLIAEDVTTFTVLKEGLLDYIFQLGDGGDKIQSGYDVVLGYTTGWEAEQADSALATGELSYMVDRAVGYLSLTNEDGKAYFLENGPVPLQLAQKYLSVIKKESDGDGSIDENVFGNKYPFNDQFIIRAYRNLVENGTPRQTPRLLLYHVIGDCLRASVPPHKRVENNPYIGSFTSPAPAGKYDTEVDRLVKWYGRLEDETIVVPVEYFETFGVDIPNQASIQDGLVQIETLYSPNKDWVVDISDTGPDPEPPEYSIVDVSMPDNATIGDSVEIEATIENEGEGTGSRIVEYTLGDVEERSTSVNLDPTEIENIHFTFDLLGIDSGVYDQSLSIDGEGRTGQITIEEGDGPTEHPEVDLVVEDLEAPDTIQVGETVAVRASVKNADAETGIGEVKYEFAGEIRETEQVKLDPDEPRELRFETEVSESGDYALGVSTGHDSSQSTVSVEDAGGEDSLVARVISHFKDWYGTGSDFPSSDRLRDGVQEAVNRFYDPTRLANPNATTDTKAAAFYYARGSDVPVEIVGADQSKDVAIRVSPFGNEEIDHEQLLYHLVTYSLETKSSGENEFDSDLNMDALRGWCDNQVQQLRGSMRSELTEYLEDPLTLERFIVLGHYLHLNAAKGTTELDRELLLRNPDENAAGSDHSSPFSTDQRGTIRENPVEIPSSLASAYSELSKRRSDLAELCRGFFLLKNNFVDHDRFEAAREYVEENFEECLRAATRINIEDIPDAYRVGTSRSSANVRVKKLFGSVADYATELRKFSQSFDTEEISVEIESIQALYNRNHSEEELLDIYERTKDALGPLDANFMESWEEVEDLLTNSDVDLMGFGQTMDTLSDADPDSPVEILAILHTYNQSKDNQDAWKIYEIIDDMLSSVEDYPRPEDTQEVEEAVRNSQSFRQFKAKQKDVVEEIEGI